MKNNNEYAIEMNNITKAFDDLIANDDITLKVKKDEIHALIAENGVGKSTLMSILYLVCMNQQREKSLLMENQNILIILLKQIN
jgi:ABC-type uncharacterized transport system ATPase subunit